MFYFSVKKSKKIFSVEQISSQIYFHIQYFTRMALQRTFQTFYVKEFFV